MVDSNSPEFEIGRKIGYCIMTYVGVKLIIKGGKLLIKGAKGLGVVPSPIPTP